MCPVLAATPNWFDSHQYFAIWLEGIALLAIFIWDRLDSRKQHEETLAQLDVSQKQVNTLINSERAWLMVEIGNLPSFDPAQGGILNLIPRIKNFGKTEGRIKRISIRLHPVPTIGGLPPEPEYLDEGNVDLILQPTIWVRPWNLALPMSDFIPIHAEAAFLYFYGYVDYIDFGEQQRQTRFCFIYTILSPFNPDPSGFYPAANVPETYTRCT